MPASERRTIDGIPFYTHPLPVMDGLVLWARLGKMTAPALVKLRGVDREALGALLAKLGDVKELDLVLAGDIMGAFGPAIVELFRHIDPADLRIVTRQLLQSTTALSPVKTKLDTDEAIEAVMEGNIGTLMKLLLWVGQVSFRSFFPAGRGADTDTTTTPTPGR